MVRYFHSALISLVLMAAAGCGGGSGGGAGAPSDLAEGIATENVPPEDQDSGNRALVPPTFVVVEPGAGQDPAGEDWTRWPESMALHVLDVNNLYANSDQALTWPDAGVGTYSNRSDCSGFVTRSLMKAFQFTGADFSSWLGSTGPSSARYHDNIVARNNFQKIDMAPDVRRGDIVAIKYIDKTSGGTGHTMIAAGTPVRRTVPTAPIIQGTIQYELRIIDSTKSPHSLDTRGEAAPAGPNGAGLGTMRLYAQEGSDQIVGYTWSLSSGSRYYTATSPADDRRSLVVGRMNFAH